MEDTHTSGSQDSATGCSSHERRRAEAEPSCVSLKSDASMDPPTAFQSEHTRPVVSSRKRKRTKSESSCVSMKSDASIDPPTNFRSEDTQPALRHTLREIGSLVAHRRPDFEFSNDALFTNTTTEPFVWITQPRRRRKRSRKRGKRAGVLVRLRRRGLRPPLPTILLANVQSLDNKLCELRARISFQRETRNCCIICLTETWLSAEVPDTAAELSGFSVHRADRTKELTGKSKGGGVCFFINNLWCDERNIHSVRSFCSPDLEYLMLRCRPYWLPREFTSVIITAVYIHPQANTEQALRELYGSINEQETAHPEAAFIVTGDFNNANLRKITPKYFQHITTNTRGDRILDHCYSPFRDAYKSLPRPPFGKSDHSSVLLLPAYRQKLKWEPPTLRTFQSWSDQSDSILQDCFDDVDWEMFLAASDDDIEVSSDTVT